VIANVRDVCKVEISVGDVSQFLLTLTISYFHQCRILPDYFIPMSLVCLNVIRAQSTTSFTPHPIVS